MKDTRYMVLWWTEDSSEPSVKICETKTEAWFIYNHLNEQKAIRGILGYMETAEVIAMFKPAEDDEPDEEPAPDEDYYEGEYDECGYNPYMGCYDWDC